MGTATNSPRHSPRNKVLSLKRIGWLYPIFRDPHFYHGLLRLGFPALARQGEISAQTPAYFQRVPCGVSSKTTPLSFN